MKLLTIGIGSVCALALSAGIAAAEMQPIPNPPEQPKKMMKHKHKHHAAKPAAAKPAEAKPAPAPAK